MGTRRVSVHDLTAIATERASETMRRAARLQEEMRQEGLDRLAKVVAGSGAGSGEGK